MSVKNVLLIGLGNVAVGFDLADNSKVLSHARAFNHHANFLLVGGVDPNLQRRDRFTRAYDCPAFLDTASAMAALSPDVVVVATPTPLHLSSVKEIFAAGQPQALLCEKPLAYELSDAQELVTICATHHCALYVNYFRLAEPGVAEMRLRLNDGRIRTPIKGVVWYSKGLFNSGAHFINLMQDLLGDATNVQVLSAGRLWKGHDPEPDVAITFTKGRVHFLAARAEDFFHNTVELLSANGRLRYEQGGAHIVWQNTEVDKRFSGYVRLNVIEESIPSDFDHIQGHVTDQFAAALSGKPNYLCSGSQALRTQELLDLIKEKL